MPGGRPSKYTKALAARICAHIADGRSLRSICREDDMPGMSTVFEWLADKPEFAEQYAHARDAQADALADEIVDIADTEEDAAKARVRVDARKWVASKLKPKRYGDRVTNEHTGAEGGAISIQVVTGVDRD